MCGCCGLSTGGYDKLPIFSHEIYLSIFPSGIYVFPADITAHSMHSVNMWKLCSSMGQNVAASFCDARPNSPSQRLDHCCHNVNTVRDKHRLFSRFHWIAKYWHYRLVALGIILKRGRIILVKYIIHFLLC